MNWLAIIEDIIALAPTFTSIINTGVSLKSVTAAVTNPDTLSALEQIGARTFPSLAPELHAVAAIVTGYSPDYTKWVQNSLNSLLVPSPNLAVDGQYGPLTQAAVKRAQQQLGLTVDGWAGDVTSAALQLALTKH